MEKTALCRGGGAAGTGHRTGGRPAQSAFSRSFRGHLTDRDSKPPGRLGPQPSAAGGAHRLCHAGRCHPGPLPLQKAAGAALFSPLSGSSLFLGHPGSLFPCRVSGAAPAVHAAVFCHHDPGVGPALRSAAGPASARQMGGARLGSLPAAGASPRAHPAVRHADGRHVPLPLPAAFSLPARVRSRRAAALFLRHHNRVPGVGPAAHSPLLCRVLPALPAAVRPGVRYPVCAGLHDLRLPPLCFAV